MARKFQLNVPCMEFDFEPFKSMDMDAQISAVKTLYAPYLTHDDTNCLLAKKKYVRIMCFQDEPYSRAYAYIYLRDVCEMPLPHQQEMRAMRLTSDEVLVEINYSTRGYFRIWSDM